MTQSQQVPTRRPSSNRGLMLLALVAIGTMAQPFVAMSAPNEPVFYSTATVHPAQPGSKTGVYDRNPFNHVASIPATSDLSTIRFEKVKATKVFTKVKATTDARYCNELRFSDPGGSMYCSSAQNESAEPAYVVTYSYTGQPLASDEYGNHYFRFQVYFRPEELPPALRSAISAGKGKGPEVAEYFTMTASRLPVRGAVIDDANSSFCSGNYVDGNWIQSDPRCQAEASLKVVTMPSEYIAVRVEPTSGELARN
jgi:hypothetical protein